jgi:hypothetical protein
VKQSPTTTASHSVPPICKHGNTTLVKGMGAQILGGLCSSGPGIWAFCHPPPSRAQARTGSLWICSGPPSSKGKQS